MIVELIVGLMILCIILAVLLVVFMWAGKELIFPFLKSRVIKGMVFVIMFGKDRRVYYNAVKFSGKSKDTVTTEINGLPYVLRPKKIRFFKNVPTLVYVEDCSEPIDVEDLNAQGITPEEFKQAIIVARQSGKLPENEKQQQIMFWVCIGAMILAGASAFLSFKTSNLIPQLGTKLDLIASLLANVTARMG